MLKTCSSVLLVAYIKNEDDLLAATDGMKVQINTLQKYGHNIMNVAVAKITTILDILSQVSIIDLEGADEGEVLLTDAKFLDQFMNYLNDENLLEPTKRHDISLKGFKIMKLIAKRVPEYDVDPDTGDIEVNLAAILKDEKELNDKEPFRIEEFPELAKLGYATQVDIRSSEEMVTTVNAKKFIRNYRFQRVVKAIDAANQARKQNPGR